jgi:iron complex transport system substrate-binding protein
MILVAGLVLLAGLAHAGDMPKQPAQRIVSLAPNLTEILFATGAAERLVGVSDYCDYPEEARKLPRVGGMSNPSLEAIVSLDPDLVVMTTDGNPVGIDERLMRMGIPVYVERSRRLEDLPSAIRGVGSAVNAPGAEALASDIEARMAGILNAAEFAGDGGAGKALFIIWPEPLIVAGPGTLLDDALRMLGHQNLAADSAINYPKYSLEEAIFRNPEIIFIGASMGNSGENIEMKKLSSKVVERLKRTSAVEHGRVYYLGDMLMRLGPRAIDGLREMSEAAKSGQGAK